MEIKGQIVIKTKDEEEWNTVLLHLKEYGYKYESGLTEYNSELPCIIINWNQQKTINKFLLRSSINFPDEISYQDFLYEYNDGLEKAREIIWKD